MARIVKRLWLVEMLSANEWIPLRLALSMHEARMSAAEAKETQEAMYPGRSSRYRVGIYDRRETAR